MKRPVRIERIGRRRKAAARGMARLGFPASIIATVLRLKRSTAQAIVEGRTAPAALWSAAEQALFREGGG
ncbi:hypothetical protein [Bosea sp. MMO-172]|uniref:hypothetical protein n=1 Tax=Bosea sp. MMO-172 TaxID=3127885 RepID=UPI003019A770